MAVVGAIRYGAPVLHDVPLDLPALEPGWVWLVGAGPGEPGLLSLLGAHALRQADVVVYDAPDREAVVALASQTH